MARSRLTVVSFLVVLIGGTIAFPDDRDPGRAVGAMPGSVIGVEGEELIYEVSWTFFTLGTIHIKTLPKNCAEGHIHSYEGLPFIDLHAIHYTTMDSSFFSLDSRSIQKKEKDWWGLNYDYDLANLRLMVDETYQNDPSSAPYRRERKDTIHLATSRFLDGLSIAFYPRMFIHTVQTVAVPTILYGQVGTTMFHFRNDTTTVDLDAVEYPVRAIEIAGTTTVEGVFGMTGDFRGWFSNDSAAVPLKGKLKVLLGNVNVELVQWKRNGWTPPR